MDTQFSAVNFVQIRASQRTFNGIKEVHNHAIRLFPSKPNRLFCSLVSCLRDRFDWFREMPSFCEMFTLFSTAFLMTSAHRNGGHRHRHGAANDNQTPTFGNAEAGMQPQVSTNNDNLIRYSEWLHLNFSHSKEYTGNGFPLMGMSGTSNGNNQNNGQVNPTVDPLATLRQLLPNIPTPNWNSWTQLQTATARVAVGRNGDPIQLPNVVPMTSGGMQPNNGFNSNYNYNFGPKPSSKVESSISAPGISPHGNSAATTGFPGAPKTSTGEPDFEDESGEAKSNLKPRPANSKSAERLDAPNFGATKSTEKTSAEKNVPTLQNGTIYWLI
ncbi:hypothetical protein M3Y95_00131600 [Aphelenchoides besseyi]|nr:hypothetical protein M3Y95_00131600 [Aphelenchoides besseyi]